MHVQILQIKNKIGNLRKKCLHVYGIEKSIMRKKSRFDVLHVLTYERIL